MVNVNVQWVLRLLEEGFHVLTVIKFLPWPSLAFNEQRTDDNKSNVDLNDLPTRSRFVSHVQMNTSVFLFSENRVKSAGIFNFLAGYLTIQSKKVLLNKKSTTTCSWAVECQTTRSNRVSPFRFIISSHSPRRIHKLIFIEDRMGLYKAEIQVNELYRFQ